jgi:hypothetical protein
MNGEMDLDYTEVNKPSEMKDIKQIIKESMKGICNANLDMELDIEMKADEMVEMIKADAATMLELMKLAASFGKDFMQYKKEVNSFENEMKKMENDNLKLQKELKEIFNENRKLKNKNYEEVK